MHFQIEYLSKQKVFGSIPMRCRNQSYHDVPKSEPYVLYHAVNLRIERRNQVYYTLLENSTNDAIA